MSRVSRHRRRRRVPRWGVAIAAVVAALVVAVSLESSRGHVREASADVIEIGAAHGASFVPALEGERPLFILALGSDARPKQNILRERSDSIHIIGVNLQTHHATVLGFPRDSWVHIPGHGLNKINTAMALGGPDLLVKTIEQLTGIHIDFWVLTGFKGLKAMVQGIGGLTVQVTQSMHDTFSGANFNPGKHHFSGSQALSFARDRHSFMNGDLTRSGNQGVLLLAALDALHKKFAKDPATVLKWIAVGFPQLHTSLDVQTIVDLGFTATQIPMANVNNLVVPASTGNVGPQSVVFISSSASKVYRDMRADGVVG